MTEREWEIVYYRSEGGKCPFKDWFNNLRDFSVKPIIDARLARLSVGNFGNCKWVGGGVLELKIDYGPGYRIYFGTDSEQIILLLCGGDKSTQEKDILRAQNMRRMFKERKP